MTLHLRRLRRHALFAVALAAILVASLSGADAKTAVRAESDTHTVASGATELRQAAAGRLTPDEKKYRIPAPITDPMNGGSDYQQPYGGRVDGTTVVASKAKAQLSVGATTALAYQRFCSDLILGPGLTDVQSCCPNGDPTANCPASAILHPPATSFDDTGQVLSWGSVEGPVWVSSPAKASRPFGVFAPAQVRLLAFGSVPATATIHLEQPLDARGTVTPLQYYQYSLQAPAGYTDRLTVAGYPQPGPVDPNDTFVFLQADRLTGPVDVRIDNLKVDGHSVDVGQSCRTSSPAQLRYVGPKGWVSTNASIATLYGKPGGFQPLGDTKGATGTGIAVADIPSFRGCRDGRGSLDPLVTSLASGPNNLVKLSLTKPLKSCIDPNTTPGEGFPCPTFPGDPLRTASQSASQSTDSATASDPSMTAARAAAIAHAMRTLPSRSRINIVDSLSAVARAKVRAALR